jgi:acyl transferase domain-containing protein/acyl carrier protein
MVALLEGPAAQEEPEPVAIVGMAGRFPGARNIDEFWKNLLDGVESISFFDDDQLRANGVSDRQLSKPNYVRAAPIIEDVDLFDAGFFGMSAREAQILDPQFRVFLEVCSTALQHAGIDPARAGGRIGVYAGSKENTYFEDNVLKNASVFRATGYIQAATSNQTDYLSTSVAYRLGLTGPALSVVTACSTALVAVHTAARALRGGECEVALAGGVEISLPMITGYSYSEGGMLSPDGHVRTFDAKARGTVFGNGAGAVVLKRLSDALADRDTVFAVIRGSAINNDGHAKQAFTAPSKAGQVDVIDAAIQDARVDPAHIGYVEAHGTGTAVGDPIEVAAITQAFARYTEQRNYCAVSSVKPNVGHLGAAAGIAALIKAVHCVREGLLPPSINFDEPNPQIDFENSALYVSTSLTSWKATNARRKAGVSSFGVGGTNAHLIVEQAPEMPHVPPSRQPYHLITLSACTDQALDAATEQLGAYLAEQPRELADAAFTLTQGRSELDVRRFVVAPDQQVAAAVLKPGMPSSTAKPARSVTFLFPGQGVQYPGMAAGLYACEPVFRATIDHCCQVLSAAGGTDLLKLLFDSDAEQLSRTEHTQPALFAVEYALARALQSRGVEPVAMAGHSIGEYVAAALAGVFDPDDALRLVAQRGALMQQLPGGAMAAVTLPEDLLLPMLVDGVDIAAVNAPGVCVVSGSYDSIATLTQSLSMHGVGIRPLHTSHAFHSRMLDPILGSFRECVAGIRLSAPRIPYISNTTGTWISDSEATDPDYWVQHLRQCVRFSDTLRLLIADGDRALVEVGPGRTLSGLAAAHDRGAVAVATMRHPQQQGDDAEILLEAIGQVWAAGAPVDWSQFWAGDEACRKIPLPTYPFERQRHWVEPDDLAAGPGSGNAPADTGQFTVPVWRETALQTGHPVQQAAPWLIFTPLAHPVLGEFVRLVQQAGADVHVAHHGADQAEVFDRIAAGSPQRLSIVHALTADTRPDQIDEADYAGHWLEHGFHSALTALQMAARKMPGTPVDMIIVTSEMQDVAGDGSVEPAKAAVIGLVKLAPKEFESVTCRSVDIGATGSSALVARQLLDEVTGGSTEEQVAYRGRKRWVWSYAGVQLADPGGVPARLRDAGVYLVTGGLGGLGLLLAKQLAGLVSARIVLVGRDGLPPREEWPQFLASSSSDGPVARKIRGVLDAEAAGGQVLVLSGDVTSQESMRAVKRATEATFGPIDGVFHLAGVAAGGMLETRSHQDAAKVLAPKVHGAYVLDRVFAPELFVLYSSLAAISGDFGLGDYVGANAVLDAFAQARWGEGRRTVSVDWPPFAETGMAADVDAPFVLLDLRGEDGGLRPTVEVAHPLLRNRRDLADGTISFEVTLTDDVWVLAEHRIGGIASYPGTGIVEMVRAAFAEITGEPNAVISDLVFLELLMVVDGLTVRLDFTPADDDYVLVLRGDDGVEYSRGRIRRPVLEQAPAVHDLTALRARCPRETPPDLAGHIGSLSLGARWDAVTQRHSAGSLELVDVRLAERFASDAELYYLHPSVLDWSVVLGQSVISEGEYLPFSYEKITVYGPLPTCVTSIVSHRDDSSGDVTVADISVVDGTGTERVVIEGFALVRTSGRNLGTPTSAVSPAAAASPAAASLRGLSALVDLSTVDSAVLNAQGEETLRLVLASGCGPQLIWCPEGLGERLRRSAGVTRAAIAASRSAKTRVTGSGSRKSTTPYVKAATGPERLLAGLWAEVIGIDQVGAEDDFFELGGNSLVAVQLVARMAQKFRVEVSVAMMFDSRTVRGLAAALGGSLTGSLAPNADEALAAPLTAGGE